eukprot:12407894-Karenia_brevis.AAC.1
MSWAMWREGVNPYEFTKWLEDKAAPDAPLDELNKVFTHKLWVVAFRVSHSCCLLLPVMLMVMTMNDDNDDGW